MTVLDFVLSAASVPALAACGYLGFLALMARARPSALTAQRRLRFDILVPAHNEETEITDTVQSLLGIAYPADQFRVIVVADNCIDATAARATAAGAAVLIRQDAERRGKGHALAFGFERSLTDGFADVVAVVDADTIVSPNLLTAFSARFERGARAVQAEYGVRNPLTSWRTRLMTIALGAFHGVRSTARERLGLSCGLRGNGMAFSAALLEAHPPRAFSIVEDLEYGLQLGYAGVRVEYVAEATVRGHMAAGDREARSQRRRWERGRRELVSVEVPKLLKAAWQRRDVCLLDLAIDLLVPPLAVLAGAIAVGLLAALASLTWGFATLAPWLWGAALAGLVLHVLQGWRYSGMGWAGLLDLGRAPLYIVWKLSLRLGDRGHAPQEWVRTEREARQ